MKHEDLRQKWFDLIPDGTPVQECKRIFISIINNSKLSWGGKLKLQGGEKPQSNNHGGEINDHQEDCPF